LNGSWFLGATETASAGIGGGQDGDCRFVLQLIKPLSQNAFNRFVSGVIVEQSSFTSCLKPYRPKRFSESDYALSGAEIIEHPMGKELLDQ
jgi:hypothetical protein